MCVTKESFFSSKSAHHNSFIDEIGSNAKKNIERKLKLIFQRIQNWGRPIMVFSEVYGHVIFNSSDIIIIWVEDIFVNVCRDAHLYILIYKLNWNVPTSIWINKPKAKKINPIVRSIFIYIENIWEALIHILLFISPLARNVRIYVYVMLATMCRLIIINIETSSIIWV